MKKTRIIFLVLLVTTFVGAVSYRNYIENYRYLPLLAPYAKEITLNEYEAEEKTLLTNELFLEGKAPILLPLSGATWNIEVPQTGLYTIFWEYLYLSDLGEDGLQILIDGQLPFDEAASLEPSRFSRAETEGRDKPIRSSSLAPTPAIIWQSRYLGDTSGRSDYPFKFFLTKGRHQITLLPRGGNWYINKLQIETYQNPPSLAEYRRLHPTELLANIDTHIILEGARYNYQYGDVDAMVYMDLEADPIREYNALGRWRKPGNGIIWEFEAPETGYYRVAFRYALGNVPLLETPLGRLNPKGFSHSERLLLIDGKIPYREVETIVFQPTDNGQTINTNYWYLYSPILSKTENETFYLEVFLTKGKHSLELIPTVKLRLPILDTLDKLINSVGQVEADFRLALGADPNPNLFYPIPEVVNERLRVLIAEVTLAKRQAAAFSRNSQVERGLDSVLSRITTLATLNQIDTGHQVEATRIRESLQWMRNYSELMPLSLDSIELYSPRNTKMKVNERNNSFWGKLKNFFKCRVNI